MMNNQPSSKRLTVNVVGSKVPTAVIQFQVKPLDKISIVNRPELIPRYISTKLCEYREQYLSEEIPFNQLFLVFQDMRLQDYFKDGKEFTEDIRCLLYYDIISNLKACGIEVTNNQALYDLLKI